MSRKREEKPIAPGDAVTVLRHCADGARTGWRGAWWSLRPAAGGSMW